MHAELFGHSEAARKLREAMREVDRNAGEKVQERSKRDRSQALLQQRVSCEATDRPKHVRYVLWGSRTRVSSMNAALEKRASGTLVAGGVTLSYSHLRTHET